MKNGTRQFRGFFGAACTVGFVVVVSSAMGCINDAFQQTPGTMQADPPPAWGNPAPVEDGGIDPIDDCTDYLTEVEVLQIELLDCMDNESAIESAGCASLVVQKMVNLAKNHPDCMGAIK
jgi:hypothetical protein